MFLAVALCVFGVAGGVVLKTDLGDVSGKILAAKGGKPYVAFLGIPYAKPPINELRFENPVSIPEDEVRLTNTGHHPACLQLKPIKDVNNTMEAFLLGEEDCLYLSVYAPMASYVEKDKKFPVLVYVHGGGYMFGEPPGSPSRFTDEEIVVVYLTYRLGPLGFAATTDGIFAGNFALQDQKTALEWISKYIKYFKGDPDNVTVFGQSAGASSVHYLMSTDAKRFFQKAILHSGSLFAPWAASTDAIMNKNTFILAENLGCSDLDTERVKSCMKNLSADTIVDTQKIFRYWDIDPVTIFGPVLTAQKLSETKIPILSGVNSLEGGIKAILLKNASSEKINDFMTNRDEYLKRMMYLDDGEDETVQNFKRFYFKNVKSKKSLVKALVHFYSDYYFLAPEIAKLIYHKGPIYEYFYDYRSRNCDLKNQKELCGIHGDELKMIFRDQDKPLDDPEDEIYADYMVKFWTNFIKMSNPTPGDALVKWKPLGSDFEFMKMTKSGFSMEKKFLKKVWSLTSYIYKLEPKF